MASIYEIDSFEYATTAKAIQVKNVIEYVKELGVK
jgi:hypothetical protein